MKIGVITPVWNDEHCIKSAIDSVKNQTFGNVVHYIFDDASTDSTQTVIRQEIPNSNIWYHRAEDNVKQSAARNHLIKLAAATGCTHIAFLDSDDTWDVDHLEKNIPYLNSYDVVFSTPRFILENRTPAVPYGIPVPDQFVGEQLRRNNFIWISSVLLKIQCVVNNEFDSQLNGIEDWDMWYRLNQQDYTFVKSPTQTVTYMARSRGQAGVGGNKHDLFRKKNNIS